MKTETIQKKIKTSPKEMRSKLEHPGKACQQAKTTVQISKEQEDDQAVYTQTHKQWKENR